MHIGHLLTTLAADAWLAARCLLRQRRRTALGLLSVGFGVAALMFATGFIEFLFWGMREYTIRSRIGHVQVAKAGYFESGSSDPFSYVLPAASAEREAIERIDGVVSVAARLQFSGLISRDDSTLSFLGEAIEPEREVELSEAVAISAGANLDQADRNGVIVGDGLAANLGLHPGDALVLLVNTPRGGINAAEVRVRGLFSTSTKAFDDAAVRMNLPLAQQLLRIDGAHLWVVALRDTADTARIAPRIRARLDRAAFDVVPWPALADFYNKTVTLFSRQVTVLKLIIALLIVLVVSNTISMSVLERTAEIGTSLAIGVGRGRVLRQFVIEGGLLGAAGGVAGAIAGTAVGLTVSGIGIPMPPPPGMGRGFTAEVIVSAPIALEAVALAVAAALLASLLPAYRVSRLDIVEALRHSR
jgi:putative ABC transport system permease protein